MKNVLITGATGNIGKQIIRFLSRETTSIHPIAAVRNIEKAKTNFSEFPNLTYRTFDFEDNTSYSATFKDIDILFLLRPPNISAVKEVFSPLLVAAKKSGIKKVVFLSVQGVEKSSIIPHHKIEALIRSLDFDFIFLRPSYFMQNLTTTLLPDILNKNKIILPSGKAKFNWVDVNNIGEAGAALIAKFEHHKNEAFEITGLENINFSEVAKMISFITNRKIEFQNINPIRFFFLKRKEGIVAGFALVMTILHFLPRLQDEPQVSEFFELLTGHKPTTLTKFIEQEKNTFRKENN